MSPTTYQWLRVAHTLGFILWLGGLLAVLNLLPVHAKADPAARAGLTEAEKRLAMVMDLGAALAIGFGLILLFALTPSPLKAGGYFHVKLTLAVGLLGLHGFARVKVGKFSRGEVTAFPAWMPLVAELLVLAIVVMVIVKPF